MIPVDYTQDEERPQHPVYPNISFPGTGTIIGEEPVVNEPVPEESTNNDLTPVGQDDSLTPVGQDDSLICVDCPPPRDPNAPFVGDGVKFLF